MRLDLVVVPHPQGAEAVAHRGGDAGEAEVEPAVQPVDMHASEIVERDDMNHDDLLSRRRPIVWPSPQPEYAETVTISARRQRPSHARPGNGRYSIWSLSVGG